VALITRGYRVQCVYSIMTKVMLLTQNVYRLLVACEEKGTKITPNYLIGIALFLFILYREGRQHFTALPTFCKLVSKVKQQSV
jgi:hypothetical protein